MITQPVFQISNLGSTLGGELTQKPLTVLSGDDQEGRTQTLYALHEFMRQPPEDNTLDGNDLEEIAQAAPGSMPGAMLRMTGPERPDPRGTLLIPAVRCGLHLFHRELMARRTSLLHQASRRHQDLQALLAPVASSQYATPVASYIDWLGCLTDIQQDARGGMKDLADELEKDVLGGKYHISPQTGYITFQSSRRGSGPVGLHAAPGCANSLMPLWVYLRHQARSRQTLMIEEPEIQLEPSQQRALMHLMLALDRCGVNVVMTTCGTHIVETVQDCAARKGTVRADPGEVAVYQFQEGTITDITDITGIAPGL